MKKTILMLLSCLSVFAMKGQGEKPVVFQNQDVVFTQIDENTWHGRGNKMYNESVYLVAGENMAIMIDAGLSMPGLHKIAEEICHKPVQLVATHVHPDHTGSAINEWDELWINAADEVQIPREQEYYKGTRKYLIDGSIIDLGGRKIEVIFSPGHTPGSTCFVDVERKYGFSGDAFGSTNLLVFTDLSTEIAGCQRMMRFIKKYDIKYFYPGHFGGSNLETPQRVNEIAEMCEEILAGKEPQPVAGQMLPLCIERPGIRVCFHKKNIR